MRKLFLHVGVHRTATTSIQRFMRANSAALLARGILFPFGVARHNLIIGPMRYGNQDVDAFARDLAERAAVKGALAVILSDEDMSTIVDIARFRPLTRHFDVKVVVSLRRQDLWLESWYLQNQKWQWDSGLAHVTLDEFFERRGEFFWIDYEARLAEYEAVFGPGSVIAGVFEAADMPGGPIATFLQAVGVSDLSGFGPMNHDNSSLTPLTTEFMRHLPLDEMAAPDRRHFLRACEVLDKGLASNGSKLIMSHARREEVLAEHAAGNTAVAQRYFGRDQLFREPLPGPLAPLAVAQLPRDATRLMDDFVTPYVRALGEELAKLRLAEAAGKEKLPVKPDRPRKDRKKLRT